MHQMGQGYSTTLSSLLRALDVTGSRGPLDVPVRGIAYHSGAVGPGFLFVAVAGTREHGHRYLADALQRGACAVVVERLDRSLPEAVAQVQVPNGRVALARLACAFYGHPSRDLILIGITGTNGKTSTVHILESVLRSAGYKVGVLGTIAYRYGERVLEAPNTTPESLDLQRMLREMVHAGTSHALMEVTSHALDQQRVLGCAFRGAAFTNLSRDHLDYHGQMASYLAAKGRLFREHLIPEADGGWALFNAQDPASRQLVKGCRGRVIWYGEGRRSVFRALNWSLGPHGTRMVIAHPEGETEIFTPLLGQYTVSNALAACACAWALGVAAAHWREGLAALRGVPGRFEPVENRRGFAVVVDYAHTPDALDRTLASARALTRGRLICVFGCGGDRDRGKRPLMAQVAARHSDLVVVTSDNPRSEPPAAIIAEVVAGLCGPGTALPQLPVSRGAPAGRGYAVVEDRAAAIRAAIRWAGAGDLVVIAGKGHETYQILGHGTIPFDDREVARKALEELGE
jgi:UDP-N-acetylmuramoyl-L-alanyl-D-glutamate--2,6-diaminopimelate ligase